MININKKPDRTYSFLQSRALGWIAVAFSGAFLIILTALRIKEGLYFDDSYMFLRYAINIVSYGNYGWNAHEHVYGCTNIPFTFYMALLRLVGADRLFGSSTMLLLSSLIWSLLSLVLVGSLINKLVGARMGYYRWLILVYTATLAVAPVFAYNVITGMDTSFSLFFNMLMILCLFRYKDKPTRISLFLAAWFSYFVYLLRPDCGIFSVLLPALFFADQNLSRKKIVLFYILLFIFFATDTFLKYSYFGNPLPLAYYVKKNGYYSGYLGLSTSSALQNCFDFLFDFGFLFLVFLVFRTSAALRKFLVFGVPLFLTIAYYFTVNQMMGFHSRYYLPSMPYFVIGTMYALSSMQIVELSFRKLLLPLISCVFILLLEFAAPLYETYLEKKLRTAATAYKMPPVTRNYLPSRFRDYKILLLSMDRIIRLLPEDATVAATENGYISVKSPRLRILDLCGLHNPEIAMNGYSDSILGNWNPVLIWMPANEYTSLRKEIITGHYFLEHYDYYPGAMDYGIAVLKNSPIHDLVIEKMMDWYYKE